MATLSNLVVRVMADTSQFVRGMDTAATATNAMAAKTINSGKRMSQIGSTMTKTVTLPLAFLGYQAIKAAADYEKSLNTMAAVADVPADELQKLDELAIQLGADTIFSTQEAASAMLELAKGGIKPAQIAAGALANTLDLAAAGDMELAESATVLSRAMNQFNLTGADSARIADSLAGAANASSADIADMALALRAGGSSAARFGITIEETSALLGMMADNITIGSDAGTLMKSALRTIVPTAKRAKDEMAALGLEFFDSKGEFIGLTAMSEELNKELGDLSLQQRETALATIFGSDATRLMGMLAQEGATGLKTYMEATTDAGAASDVATAKMKGLPGALEQLSGSAETATLALGRAMEPAIRGIAMTLTQLINVFTALPKPMQSVIAILLTMAAAAGPSLWVWGKLKVGIASLVGPLMKARAAWLAYAAAAALSGQTVSGFKGHSQAVVGGLLAQSKTGQLAAKAWSSLTVSLGGSLAALGAIGAVLAATTIAVIAWYKAYEAAATAAEEANKAIMASVDIINAYAEATAAGKHSLADLRAEIVRQMESAAEAGANQEELNAIWDAGQEAIKRYNQAAKVHIKTGNEIVTMTKESIRAQNDFAGMTREVYDKWAANTVGNFNVVEGALGKLAQKHKVTADQILSAMRKAMEAQIDFQKNWGVVVDRAGEKGEDFVRWIQENYGAKAPAFVAALAKANDKEFSEMVRIWNRAASGAQTSSTRTAAAFSVIPRSAVAATNGVRNSIGQIPQIVAGQAAPARSAAYSVGNAIVAGMSAALNFDAIINKITQGVKDGVQAGKDAAGAKSPSREMMNLGNDMVDGLLIGLGAYDRLIERRMAGLVTGAIGQAEGVEISIKKPESVEARTSSDDGDDRGGWGGPEHVHFHGDTMTDPKKAVERLDWYSRSKPFNGR